MHFASPLPAWLVVVIVRASLASLSFRIGVSCAVVARAACRARAPASLVDRRAGAHSGQADGRGACRRLDVVVPVLVDVSRSMRVPDGANGRARIEEATDRLRSVLPGLGLKFKPEVYAFGETVAAVSADGLSADARRSDLGAAIANVRERYRGRPVAGVVVLTDGAETDTAHEAAADAPLPVYPIGIGSSAGPARSRSAGLSAGDPRLDAATVDLKVTAVSRGFGREAFQLRVLADGRVIDSRRVEPSADGSPVDVQFTVLPDP